MTYYRDYFRIRPDFAPMMTRKDINKSPKTWLGFYPHDSFVEILRALLKSLDGNPKTLWVTGAYGTGKSHATLVLQKLFCDDSALVAEYLDMRKEQIPDALKRSLLARRQEGVLVVYDVNSDGVDSKNQFLMRLQRGIVRALRDGGHQIPLKGKLDEVIERIHQEATQFFAARDSIQEELSFLNAGIHTAEDLEKKLRDTDLEVGLMSDVMRVFETRHIFLGLEADDFLAWVDEALQQNGLSKLVFIWDEFSAFIERNRSELKTLEQLAEAAQQGRFYFVPVTHLDISAYLSDGSDSAKKANNRFVFKRLDMPNETALKLAADAFVVEPDQGVEWERERTELWHSVSGVVDNYMIPNNANIAPDDFKGILPIHPMAAFLLKQLSVSIGSNQRSMFEFLNGEEFDDFITRGGLEIPGKQLLTVDHLWHYFIERDELGTDKELHEARTEYVRHEKALQPDQQRIFKAVLLFGLVEQLQGTGHALLSATVENIQRCFEGDGSLDGVDAILHDLESNHCFSIMNGRCERFRDRSNRQDIEEKKKSLENKFDELVLGETQTELANHLKGVNYGGRYTIRAAGANGISPSKIPNRESFGPMGNKILLQFILARDAQEQLTATEKAKSLAQHFSDHRMLFLTVPEAHFCRDNKHAWDEFTENNAHLVLSTDTAAKNAFQVQINAATAKWNLMLKDAPILQITIPNLHGDPFLKEVSWRRLLDNELVDYAKQTFSAYTDDLSGFNVSAVGNVKALQSWALAGMSIETFNKPGAWKTVIDTYKNMGIRGDEAWFDEHPRHSLTQLRDKCKKWQDNTVGSTGGLCSIRKLYIDLQRPPFGLLCIPHSAFVLGFVLKIYLTGQRNLQWTDGIQSRPLDSTTLAEIIEAVVKDDGQNNIKNEKLICRLSREEKVFIEQCGTIFGFSSADGTVEAALNAIAAQLQQITQRVPLWVLPDYIRSKEDPSSEVMGRVIDALCEAKSISSKGDTELRGNKVKEIGALLEATPGLAEALSKYMKPLIFDEAFQDYVDSARPELRAAALRLGDSSHVYCDAIKKRFVEMTGWLWKRGDVESILNEVYLEILCAEHIRDIAGTTGYLSFEDALQRLCSAMFTDNKIPTEYWAKKYPALINCFRLLEQATMTEDDVKKLETILVQQIAIIKQVFFDARHEAQLEAMRDIFGKNWPSSPTEAKSLYQAFTSMAQIPMQIFQEQGYAKIEEYGRNIASKQIAALWEQKTGTKSPEAWSRLHSLPAAFVLADLETINVVIRPAGFSAEHVQATLVTLGQENAFVDLPDAGRRFLERVLSTRYQKICFDVSELGSFLRRELNDDPNRWLTDTKLSAAIEAFIKKSYQKHARKQAEEKVVDLTDVEAKALLLKLIREQPDVGLAVL